MDFIMYAAIAAHDWWGRMRCKHRFSCPYHAWTWDNTGRFINAPHRAQGFPDLNPDEKGLKNHSDMGSNGLYLGAN